jgi:hypothetical protein
VRQYSFLYYLDNKFIQNRTSGYVGVHGNLLVNNSGNLLQAELQVHFYYIMDGTQDCPKEFTHKIYEATRSLLVPPIPPNADVIEKNGNIAQTLVFLFGLSRVASISLTFSSTIVEDTSTYLYNLLALYI